MNFLQMALQVRRLSATAKLPVRATYGSAGMDLFADQDCNIPPKGKCLVNIGISIALPHGTYGRIAPRSGLASKNYIDVGAGVIDSDYRGEIKVLLYNFSDEIFQVKCGERIAQLICEKIVVPTIIEIHEMNETLRGSHGFGSTGK